MATPLRPTDQSLIFRKIEALAAKTVANGCTEAEVTSALAKMKALIGGGETDPPARQNFSDADPMDRIVTLARAVELSGLSDDSWRRHHKHKFVRLSERRIGVRLRDALMRAE
jgi:hypothetical protein